MPGFSLYDFGDLVRTCTSGRIEDDPDPFAAEVRLDLFQGLAAGYLDSAGGFLTAVEIQHLVFAGKLITFETGLRFLTDYLQGDPYFKTAYQEHNLTRCNMQFGLVASIERQSDAMNQIVRELT